MSAENLLTTALVGALLPPDVPEGQMLRGWLDSRTGVGHAVDAMTAWGPSCGAKAIGVRMATEFYRESSQHTLGTWAGVGTDVVPWRAVQMGRWTC